MFLFQKKITDNDNIVYKHDNNIIFKWNLSELNKNEFVNWNQNRPPDPVRIHQIQKYYKQNCIKIIPGIIYAWSLLNDNDNKYIIYDGIHRLLAGFESKLELYVLIQIKYTDREQDIVDDFMNINKSISVPSVYLEQNNTLKRIVCESVVNTLCLKYPMFVSSSNKCHTYNFNRDNVIQFISELNIDFTKHGIDKMILNEMDNLNNQAYDFVKKHKINHPSKCKEHNFYLFYLDKLIIKNAIEKSVFFYI